MRDVGGRARRRPAAASARPAPRGASAGMAAGEDQPQPVVGDRVGLVGASSRSRRLDQQRQLGPERLRRVSAFSAAAARPSSARRRAGPGRRRAPTRRARRRTRPARLLGGVEVARDAHRRGEHEGPLAPVRVGDRLLDRAQSTTWKPSSGRTSTPPSTIGVILASSSAWSRSRASMTKIPASSSLVSMNGPSVSSSPRIDGRRRRSAGAPGRRRSGHRASAIRSGSCPWPPAPRAAARRRARARRSGPRTGASGHPPFACPCPYDKRAPAKSTASAHDAEPRACAVSGSSTRRTARPEHRAALRQARRVQAGRCVTGWV